MVTIHHALVPLFQLLLFSVTIIPYITHCVLLSPGNPLMLRWELDAALHCTSYKGLLVIYAQNAEGTLSSLIAMLEIH